MLIKNIHTKIHEIRNQKVMIDFDLAALYEVETRALNQSVKRNIDLFPDDFMFQLTELEWKNMSSQIVMTYSYKRPKTSLPLVFTEHGVSMLANVLKSKKARLTSIAIVKAFISLKQFIINYSELTKKMQEIETKYNKQFADVYEALNYLMGIKKEEEKVKKRKLIGYK
jgi:ORF6N domain